MLAALTNHVTLNLHLILPRHRSPLANLQTWLVHLQFGCSTNALNDRLLFLCSEMGERAVSASAFQPYSCDASTAAGAPVQHEGEDESSHNDTVSLPYSIAVHIYMICQETCRAYLHCIVVDAASPKTLHNQSLRPLLRRACQNCWLVQQCLHPCFQKAKQAVRRLQALKVGCAAVHADAASGVHA